MDPALLNDKNKSIDEHLGDKNANANEAADPQSGQYSQAPPPAYDGGQQQGQPNQGQPNQGQPNQGQPNQGQPNQGQQYQNQQYQNQQEKQQEQQYQNQQYQNQQYQGQQYNGPQNQQPEPVVPIDPKQQRSTKMMAGVGIGFGIVESIAYSFCVGPIALILSSVACCLLASCCCSGNPARPKNAYYVAMAGLIMAMIGLIALAVFWGLLASGHNFGYTCIKDGKLKFNKGCTDSTAVLTVHDSTDTDGH